jgi:hypothetical protein
MIRPTAAADPHQPTPNLAGLNNRLEANGVVMLLM